MIKKITLITLLSTAVAIQTLAHDLWVHASDFKPKYNKIGTSTILYAGYGHRFPVENAYTKENSFTLHYPDNKKKVIKGKLLAKQMILKEKGNYIVTGKTKPSIWSNFENSKGEKVWRQESKNNLKNVIYSKKVHKYAKGILTIGETNNKNYSKVLGETLEFIPLENPNNIKSLEKELNVKVLFKGNPLSNVDVYGAYAGFSNKGDLKLLGKTNINGIVKITPEHPGYWILKVEHTEPTLKEFQNNYDDEAYVATLTFQVQ